MWFRYFQQIRAAIDQVHSLTRAFANHTKRRGVDEGLGQIV